MITILVIIFLLAFLGILLGIAGIVGLGILCLMAAASAGAQKGA